MTGGRDWLDAFNLVEAGWWLFVAAALLSGGPARGRLTTAERGSLAVVFVLFGLSDVVESSTGAWWRPWWLAVWKAGCVAAFIAVVVRAAVRERQASAATSGLQEATEADD